MPGNEQRRPGGRGGAEAAGRANAQSNSTSAKAVHLHLARIAGVDVDLILGDLAQMGWALTDEDVEFLAEFPARMTGAGA